MKIMENISDGKDGDQIHREEVNWTNERHLDFLSSLENTFVENLILTHRLAAIHQRYRCRTNRHKLDRYVSDMSESTRNLRNIRNTSRSVKLSHVVATRSGKRQTIHPYKISVDDLDEQVVPQL